MTYADEVILTVPMPGTVQQAAAHWLSFGSLTSRQAVTIPTCLLLAYQPQPLVPLVDALPGVFLEAFVLWLCINLHPARLAAQHEVSGLRWYRQFRVDSRRERMHEFWPATVVDKQGTPAVLAEMPLGGAFPAIDDGMIDRRMLFTIYPQAIVVATQVDGISASACGLAAYRAVAAVVGVRVQGFEFEMY